MSLHDPASRTADTGLLARLAAFNQADDPRLRQILLRSADAALTLLAFVLAYIVRYQLEWFKDVEPIHVQTFQAYLPSALSLVVVQLAAFQLAGVYGNGQIRGWLHETWTVANASTLTILVLIMGHLFFNPQLYSRLVFLYTAIMMTGLLGGLRLGLWAVRRLLYSHGLGHEKVLLVGTGELGLMLMRNIVAQPDLGWHLLGFLDEEGEVPPRDIGRFRLLGSVTDLPRILRELRPDRVIICLPQSHAELLQQSLETCREQGIQPQVVPNLFQVTRNQIKLDTLQGVPLLSEQPISITGWNYWLKRLADLVLFVILMVPSLIVGAVIAAAIKLESGGPVIYAQTRVGRHGNPIRVFKFRTMVSDADARLDEVADLDNAQGIYFKIKDDPRCTRVGRFLRSFSLDEVPQFINVVRGDMSFIGPRPGLPAEVERYEPWHQKRLAVFPGITGLWQVSGRSDLTFDEMVLLDIYYAENWNLGLDLSIALRTIPTVLLRRGAY